MRQITHMTRRPGRPGPPRLRTVGLWAVLLAVCPLVAVSASRSLAAEDSPPNVLMILTDDQRYDELESMPSVRELIADEGVTFERAYVSYPLCCPSRASLLTGLYAHNHDVQGNSAPRGGWAKFQESGEQNALPVRLQDAGYRTGLAGKYMNGYLRDRPETPAKPPGWDFWSAKTSEGNFLDFYYNFNLASSVDQSDPMAYEEYGFAPGDYMTDVVGAKALQFLEGHQEDTGPFMLAFWPGGPHFPFEPAPRHWGLEGGHKLEPLAGSNEQDISDKPAWLRKVTRKISKASLRRIAGERRRRLEQLMSVDEAVGSLIAELERTGELDNTYVVFTSDNGYFRGEHRIPSGKFLSYEPSARVPLIIRGPGLPAGEMSRELVSLVDVPQTILEIATGSIDPAADGRSLLPYASDPDSRSTRPLVIEGFSGGSIDDGDASVSGSEGNPAAGLIGVGDLEQEPASPTADRYQKAGTRAQITWRAPGYLTVRTGRYAFTSYSNGELELYDMKRDPAQLQNVAANRRYIYVKRWLSDLLVEISNCSGEACREGAGPQPVPLRKN
jgi:N-acetylglucosamine-6-sulfatase